MRRAMAVCTAVGVLSTLTAVSHSASAWVRETVEGAPDTPLVWNTRNIMLRAAYDSSADVAPADVERAIRAALATWENAGGGCSDITLTLGSPPSGLETNLTGGSRDNENRIVWREGAWPEDPEQLALTTIVYTVGDGRILDADIDVNGGPHFWTTIDTAGSMGNDIQNTITHEIGHLIGFAHSPNPDATMFGRSGEGEISKRDLASDDIDGLCAVYPFGEITPPDLGVRGGLRSESCAVSPGSGDSRLAWFVLVVVLVAIRRRARSRLRPF